MPTGRQWSSNTAPKSAPSPSPRVVGRLLGMTGLAKAAENIDDSKDAKKKDAKKEEAKKEEAKKEEAKEEAPVDLEVEEKKKG
jgi:hypothetical protein